MILVCFLHNSTITRYFFYLCFFFLFNVFAREETVSPLLFSFRRIVCRDDGEFGINGQSVYSFSFMIWNVLDWWLVKLTDEHGVCQSVGWSVHRLVCQQMKLLMHRKNWSSRSLFVIFLVDTFNGFFETFLWIFLNLFKINTVGKYQF